MNTYIRYAGFFHFPPVALERISFEKARDTVDFPRYLSELIVTHRETAYNFRVSRDGLLMLHLTDDQYALAEKRDSEVLVEETGLVYFRYLNALYLLLDSAIINATGKSLLFLEELSVRDLCVVTYDENDNLLGYCVLSQGYANYIDRGRYLVHGTKPDAMLRDDRYSGRLLVPTYIFHKLNEVFREFCEDATVLGLLSQTFKSISEYNKGNYEVSLVLSWFSIEHILFELVKVSEMVQRPDNLTAEQMIGIVKNENLLPKKIIDAVDRMRRIRNRIVHSFQETRCLANDCIEAFEIVKCYLRQECDLSLSINTDRRLKMIR